MLLYNDFIFEAFKNKTQVDSIYFDFSKAFDTFNHERLLGKVWNAGIRQMLYRWLRACLVGRPQSIKICAAESYPLQPTSGVPQGSNLGRLLFCIYINDLFLFFPNCKLLLYSDDAKLYLVLKDINDLLKLEQEIDTFLLWASVNRLSVNSDKCCFMSFARGQL